MRTSELRQLLKSLEAQGFTIRRTAKGHWFVSLDGVPITTLSGTPSDHRSSANALAKLKRAGFKP